MTHGKRCAAALAAVLAWCGAAAAHGQDRQGLEETDRRADAPDRQAYGHEERPQAETLTLTLGEALERARRAAPEVRAARARVGIARGRVVGASPWQPFNPEVEAGAGPRFGNEATRVEGEVGLRQRFELGGRRSARLAAARARVEAAQAGAEETARGALSSTATTFLQGLAAVRRSEVRARSAELATALRDLTLRRYEAGDVGVLDVHLARVHAARAEALARAAHAEEARVKGELKVLCGLGPSVELRLEGALRADGTPELAALLAELSKRPDLRALEAQARAAAADLELGEALRWPDLGVFVRYAQEEDAHLIRGGLSLSLPVFERGQGMRATARAREQAARVEHEARYDALFAALHADYRAWRLAHEAATELDRAVETSLEETVEAARRAYEAGGVGLADLLTMQREMVDARLVQADLWLEAALWKTALLARAGVFR